jgi:Undecaprenyl-phosphate glucose phosphotransferase
LSFGALGKVAFAVDLLIVVGVSVVAGILYRGLLLGMIGDVQTLLGVGILVFANFSALLAAWRNYHADSLMNFRRQLREISLGWLLTCFVLLLVGFVFKITDEFSRGATITFFIMGWASVLIWRGFFASFICRALANGGFSERKIIIVVEEGQSPSSKALRQLQRCGYKPVRTFELSQADIAATGIPAAMRNALDAVIETARVETVENIFLLIRWDHRRCIEHLVTMLRVLPIPIHLVPDPDVARLFARPVAHIGAVWTAELKRAPLTSAERLLKRTLDIFGATVGLVLLSPLLLLVALVVKLDSPGLALFTQTRNGFNGRGFRIFKFRTMYVAEDGPQIRQATRGDLRVTRFGRVLRRTNIDELPQLLNVLIGDMSLVGPRPHAAAHNTEYEKLIADYAFRYHVKPGITGWAQVNGFRGETPTVDLMSKRIELDLWYINNWSIWLDIRILVKTLMLGLQTAAY